jgi:hypothetical protein
MFVTRNFSCIDGTSTSVQITRQTLPSIFSLAHEAKWGLPTNGETLKLLDRYLEKDYKNVVVILLDGMGKCVIEHNLEKNGFFNTHLAGTYVSTFPSTNSSGNNFN